MELNLTPNRMMNLNSARITSCIISPQATCESPESSNCESPEFNGECVTPGSSGRENNRRGRPRSEILPTLIFEGVTSPSSIKCKFCNRAFPREKSLQAHLRTHTGERPYLCDYPGCTRAFTQSGQLKTHQRLHTGERPFVCAAPNCNMRFTHANRHCPDHPYDQLKRCDDFVIAPIPEQNNEVIKWIEKYRTEREDRTPSRKTPKRSKLQDNNENSYENNFDGGAFPVTPNTPYKSRKGLMVELDMNAGIESSPLTGKQYKSHPKIIKFQDVPPSNGSGGGISHETDDDHEIPRCSAFNQKKKWLREAWQDELAKPLDPLPPPPPQHQAPAFAVNPNQNRPTVLMVASKDKTIPLTEINFIHNNIESPPLNSSSSSTSASCSPPSSQSPFTQENRKWMGALALMEMATDESGVIKYNSQDDSDFVSGFGTGATACAPISSTSYTQL